MDYNQSSTDGLYPILGNVWEIKASQMIHHTYFAQNVQALD